MFNFLSKSKKFSRKKKQAKDQGQNRKPPSSESLMRFERAEERRAARDAQGALDDYRFAAEAQPQVAQYLCGYGCQLIRVGDSKEGIALLQRALQLDESDLDCRTELARALISAGDYGNAMVTCATGLESNGRHFGCRIQLGRALLASGDTVRARKELLYAVTLRSDNASAQFELGHCYEAMGDKTQAIAHFEKALSLEPKRLVVLRALARCTSGEERFEYLERFCAAGGSDADVLFNLALEYSNRGNLDSAINCLRTILHRSSDFTAAHKLLAHVHLESALAQLEFSRQHVIAALARTPDDVQLHEFFRQTGEKLGITESINKYLSKTERSLAIGTGATNAQLDPLLERVRALRNKGDFSSALDHVGAALENFDDDYRLHFERGLSLLKLNQLEDAQSALKHAVSLAPQRPALLHELGRAHMRANDWSTAAQALHKALELDPTRYATHHELARVYSNLGRYEPACLHFRSAIRCGSQSIDSQIGLARALLKRNESEEALRILKTLVLNTPDSFKLQFELGCTLYRERRHEAAHKALLQASILAPHDPRSYHELGRTCMAVGAFDEAEEWFRRAFDTDASRHESLRELGRAFASGGKYEAALKHFDLAREIAPDDPSIPHARGRVLVLLGRHQEAFAEFETAVGLNPRHGTSHFELAMLAQRDGKTSVVLTHLSHAIEGTPTSVNYLLARSRAYFEAGDSDRALEDARLAAELEPSNEKVCQLNETLNSLISQEQVSPTLTIVLQRSSDQALVAQLMDVPEGVCVEALFISAGRLHRTQRDGTTEIVTTGGDVADERAAVDHALGSWIFFLDEIDKVPDQDSLAALIPSVPLQVALVRNQEGLVIWRKDALLLGQETLSLTPGPASDHRGELEGLMRSALAPTNSPIASTDVPFFRRSKQPPQTQRVLLVSLSGVDLFGGVEHFLRSMVSVYSALGFECVIVGMRGSNGGAGDADGFRYLNIENDAASLRKAIFAERPALLHATTGIGFTVTSACKYLDIPVIYGTHFWRDMFQGNDWFANVDREGVPQVDFHHLIQNVAVLYSNSDYVRDVTEKHFQVLSPVLYSLPVDTLEPLTRADSARYLLIINARLEKGFGLVLDLAEQLPHRQFVAIAGQSPVSEALHAVSQRGLKNVRVVGRTDDMRSMYRGARAVLVPSYAFVETFSRAVIEAHREGVPVIGSDRGNVPVLLKEAGVSLPEEVTLWRKEVERLFDNEDYFQDRRSRALENSKRYAFADQEARVRALVASAQKRVLIAVGSGIGNIVQVSPMIRKISEAWGVRVDVVIREDFPGCSWLLGVSPYVNMVFALGADVVRRHYELVFVTDCFGEVIPHFDSDNVIVTRRKFPFNLCATMHESEFNMHCMTELLGIKRRPDDYKRYFLGGFERQATQPRRIGLHAGGKTGVWAVKRWPYYEALSAQLKAEGWEVVSLGGPDEHVEGTVNLTGTPLKESLENVSSCAYFIANDCGLMHVADALNIPLTALFGPTSVIKNGPLGLNSSVIQLKKDCAPCQFTPRFRSCTPACMAEISLDEVLNQVRRALQDHYGEGSPVSTPVESASDVAVRAN